MVAAWLALAAPAEAVPRFERCGPFGFECTRVSVPLDRSGALPGRVSLFVKRVRARERPRRGALIVLAGGPGQSATDAFGGSALSVLHPAYRNRDLLIFDQRGTGRSGLLRCRALERSNLLDAGTAAGRCAARLGPRRALYTSRDSAEDVESIRVALGYERIALFGTSYGTKVALGYALSHPGSVERLVLDSVVEAEGPNPLYLDTLEAVPRVLRVLCRARCRAFTPDPVADVATLVRRLARRPLRGPVVGRAEWFGALLSDERTCSSCWSRATSIPLCERRSRVPCAPRSTVTPRRFCACAIGPTRWTGRRPRRACSAARCTRPPPARRRRSRGRARVHPTPSRGAPRLARPPRRFRPAPSSPSIARARWTTTWSICANAGSRRRTRPFSDPARCPTCPCFCSRARTTCAHRSRTRAGWRPGSRVPGS